MTMNLRSLRVRLFVLYLGLVLFSMICLGSFSYWYLSKALASARERTMIAREQRILAYMNSWPAKDTSLGIPEKLRQLSMGIAETDIIQLYELDGTPIYATPGHDDLKLPFSTQPCIQRCLALVHTNGHTIRTLNHVVSLHGRQVRLSLSGTIDEHSDVLQAVRNSYLLFCPLLLLVSTAGGYGLSRRALMPVGRMTAEARTIGIQDLKRRLPVPETGDELQTLAESWNELLHRLDSAVSRLTQFTGDISHDLKTTITVMLTTAGLALSKPRSAEEYKAALNTIALECEVTSRLLDDLLAIARADVVPAGSNDPVNMSTLVAEVCEQFSGRARWKQQRLDRHVQPDAWVRGQASLLRRLIGILLDNAIKYTPAGGSIEVSLTVENPWVKLTVRDTGSGIAPGELEKIFDRFYRADKSRSGESSGSGLGLSIAKWVADAHRSFIFVQSTLARGSTFTVHLPTLDTP
jgi:heavy metal sensor kinase